LTRFGFSSILFIVKFLIIASIAQLAGCAFFYGKITRNIDLDGRKSIRHRPRYVRGIRETGMRIPGLDFAQTCQPQAKKTLHRYDVKWRLSTQFYYLSAKATATAK